jgi:mannose-6-phosphate isomerase-like protein (cupin superfamily)
MKIFIQNPNIVQASGNIPKKIWEFVDSVNSNWDDISIARMKSPEGWEPGQRPQFDDYTVVIKGTLVFETESDRFEVKVGQAFIANKGGCVRYSTPYNAGAAYMAACRPAFKPELVNRDL